MVKKWLPYLFALAAIVALVFLMNTLNDREKLGMKLTHPKILTEGALFVILMTIAISMLLKKI